MLLSYISFFKEHVEKFQKSLNKEEEASKKIKKIV